MDLPTVNPGDLIKAAHINKISSSLEYLAEQVHGGSAHTLSGARTISATVGHHEIDLTGDCSLTIDRADAGTHPVVSLDVKPAGKVLTILDSEVAPITENSLVSVVWSRGTWKGGTGGAPATPDATPPTALTSVTVTGIGESSAELSWPAATDPESTVQYSWRAYKTGTTPPAYTLTSARTATVTGLTPSTGYTVQVYSHSNGGATTPATASFTTKAGWRVVRRYDFTGIADGTPANGVTPSIGTGAIVAEEGATIVGGKLDIHSWPPHITETPPWSHDSGEFRSSMTYTAPDLASEGSVPAIAFIIAGGASSAGPNAYVCRIGLHRPQWNDSTLTLSAPTTYDAAGVITMESGRSRSGFPLSGTLTIHRVDDRTVRVYIDGALWATITPSETNNSYGKFIGLKCGAGHSQNKHWIIDDIIDEVY